MNPATGEIFFETGIADGAAVDVAVQTAQKAQRRWNAIGLKGRLEVIEHFREAVEDRKEELTTLIATETGKPLWDARAEAMAVIGKIAISIEAYRERTGKHRKDMAGVRQELRHRPLGVMAVFGPYNFPAHLPNGHMVPALIAGNAVVFKPSEETPATGEWLAKLWHDVGLPDGVINLVQGGAEVGQALVQHPWIHGLLITGSYATGKAIHQALAGRPEVLLALEMGGNNPLIVWEAGDPEAAAKLILQSAYVSSGQRCTCARRLILPQGKDGDKVVDALLALLARVRIGPPKKEPEPFMGPLINMAQAEEVHRMEMALTARGGHRLAEVKRLSEDLPFLTPGLIDVTDAKKRRDRECFGPLLQIIRTPDFTHAIEEANNTAYGLAAGLISENKMLWKSFLALARAGIINWNRPTTGASSAAPFGGIGQSGNYRPAAYYAADYCAYPLATLATDSVEPPPEIVGLNEA